MRTRTALVALLLGVAAAGLLGGTASAEPYLPPGKPVPATGVIQIEGGAPAVATAGPARRPSSSRVRHTGARLVPRR